MLQYPSVRGLSRKESRELKNYFITASNADGFLAKMDEQSLIEFIYSERLKVKSGDETANMGLLIAGAAEVCKRNNGLSARPGQIAVAIALAKGYMVEYPTGEGKTLSAALAAIWLSARYGTVHIATDNDYLAFRDCESFTSFFEKCGLTVKGIYTDSSDRNRRESYKCDIIYATLDRIASDYLGDQLVYFPSKRVNPRFGAIIVDEADSLLLDRATNSFTLAGKKKIPEGLDKFVKIAAILKRGSDYEIDESRSTAWLLDSGIAVASKLLDTTDIYSKIEELQWLHAALIVRNKYFEGVHYIKQDNKLLLIDQSTGRIQPTRRLISGLHPILEATAGVYPDSTPVPIARISVRSFVMRYAHLAGMAGTLSSDSAEITSLYDKKTVIVGAHHPSKRIDHNDRVYATRESKINSIVEEVKLRHHCRQPILIGSGSVNEAEILYSKLINMGIEAKMLTAREHSQEAEIIAEAGSPGAVTIVARMAGRGVDIILGGKDGKNREIVLDQGGLCVIATERFASRRADQQIRGRAGRQGDPGESIFFASCEDDIVSMFTGDKLNSILPTTEEYSKGTLRIPGIGAMLDRAQQQIEQINAQIRIDQIQIDNNRDEIQGRFYYSRENMLVRRDIKNIISWAYEVLLAGEDISLKNGGILWPSSKPVPEFILQSKSKEILCNLTDECWNDLFERLSISSPPGIDPLIVGDSLVCSILEITDSHWSNYLAAETLNLLGSGQGGSLSEFESNYGYAEFQKYLARRIISTIWLASFKVDTR
jgi:preprotein translocase subunit SecA